MDYSPYVVTYTTDAGLAMLVRTMLGVDYTTVSHFGVELYCFPANSVTIPAEFSADFDTSILYYSFMLSGGW